MSSNCKSLKLGTEIDSSFADAHGAAHIESAGFGWYRHVALPWARWQPNSGNPLPWDLTAWEQEIDDGLARASESGLRTIMVIRDAPAWATISGIGGCGDIKTSAFIPFVGFLNNTISRYKASPFNIRHYELWNEPDDKNKPPETTEVGCRSAGNYAAMLQVVYPAVKQAHPDVKILSGGVVQTGWWAKTVVETSIRYMDGFGYHAYENIDQGALMWRGFRDSRPAEYLKRLDAIRSWIRVSPRPETPIYMTEGGGVTHGNVTAEQAERIQSFFVAFMAAQILSEPHLANYVWFRSLQGFTSSFGRSISNTFTPNSIYDALKFAAQMTLGASHIATTRASNGSAIKLLTSIGEAWLVWNTNAGAAPAAYSLGFTPSAVYDVWGNALSRSETLNLSGNSMVVWVVR